MRGSLVPRGLVPYCRRVFSVCDRQLLDRDSDAYDGEVGICCEQNEWKSCPFYNPPLRGLTKKETIEVLEVRSSDRAQQSQKLNLSRNAVGYLILERMPLNWFNRALSRIASRSTIQPPATHHLSSLCSKFNRA